MRTSIQKNQGFTLIELMIVVAIVAILAAVAYPAYIDSVRKAKRSDGIDALLSIQLEQEKLRGSCATYAGTIGGANNCAGSTVQGSDPSPEGYYDLEIAGAGATGYTLTATGQNGQENDAGCNVLTLTVNGANPNGLKAPANCWSR